MGCVKEDIDEKGQIFRVIIYNVRGITDDGDECKLG